jgi:phage terminase small subunit
MLTAKQEAFVQSIIKGMSQADAYRSAYDTSRMTDKTVHEKASRLMSDDKVRARLQELRDQMMTPSIMTAQERLEYLTRIVRGDEKEIVPQIINGEVLEVEVPSSIKTRLDALDKMNKMTGEYVQKVQAAISYEDSLRKVVDEDEY